MCFTNTTMNMRNWLNEKMNEEKRKALPVLSFPSIQLLDITVKDLIFDSETQAKGMKAVADRTPDAAAAVSLMDLSVEAECFGAKIHISDDEVPTVVEPVIDMDAEEDERNRIASRELKNLPAKQSAIRSLVPHEAA